ncbi:class I SAM-dependent methyltransferase [Rhabdobacter roseus]|uniref:Putative O-methyltransferase YrrM n=1 Tax=Rhabdobacter roseus TaxID=1655419 RepID=A0A840TJC7_9BACT|nr:class I SAM-dependent methyltransferase [Rhabdobacter roseus]MBB5283544.1 putative O-methyltransferase YrrM [Rhabdobacter roseus]
MILHYLKYLLRSGNEHAIHSPFLFELYTQVIRPRQKDQHPDYTPIQRLRRQLLRSRETIRVLDLGAGSRVDGSDRRQVSRIARNAEKPAKFGKLFHRLVRRYQPTTTLELGTSLGVTTMYFAKGYPSGRVLTLEGCPETARIAQENFAALGVENVEVILGNIDTTLPGTLQSLNGKVDLVFFDANHRYEPTVRYFETCLPYVHNDTLFIFDDIYWSDEMVRAWAYIKDHPQVRLTVDLFWIGLVFFRKEQAKEDFTLRF